jgi:transposase
MKPLANDQVQNTIALLNSGHSYEAIKARVGISKGAIHNIKEQYLPDHEGKSAGRPRILSDTTSRNIVRQATLAKLHNTVEIQKHLQDNLGINASQRTIGRTLKSAEMYAGRTVRKALISAAHRKKRLDFARRHENWTVADWKRVVWSDETSFVRDGSKIRKIIWKKRGRGFQPQHVQYKLKHGGGKIFAWGCITAEGVGYLTKINGGLDAELYVRILDDELMRTIKYYRLDKKKLIFQQDGDPKHTAKITKEWLEDSGLHTLEWPPNSPDMNPIENIWLIMEQKLQSYDRMATGELDLWERAEEQWESITKEECLNLIESMPRRIEAVIKAKGGLTKY